MTRVVARNALHLKELVREALVRRGPRCSLNHIDVSGVDDFSWLFNETEFDGDVSEWDMSNAINLTAMFRQSYFSGDTARWNTASMVQAGLMFANCPFNGDVSSWNTSKLVQAYDMFGHSGFSGDVSAWDVSSVVSTSGMFANSEFRGDVSAWNVARVRDMSRMFDQLATPFDLRTWAPQRLRKAEAVLSAECLDAMAEPCFYHWYAALTQRYRLRPSWQRHLAECLPIATSFHRHDAALAVFLQEQWMRKSNPGEPLALPCLDM